MTIVKRFLRGLTLILVLFIFGCGGALGDGIDVIIVYNDTDQNILVEYTRVLSVDPEITSPSVELVHPGEDVSLDVEDVVFDADIRVTYKNIRKEFDLDPGVLGVDSIHIKVEDFQ